MRGVRGIVEESECAYMRLHVLNLFLGESLQQQKADNTTETWFHDQQTLDRKVAEVTK